MAGISIKDYLQRVSNAQYGFLGKALANLLSCRDIHVMSSRLMIEYPERPVQAVIYPTLDEVVIAHIKTIYSLGRSDLVEAWKNQMQVVNALSKFLSESKEENWMLPVVYTASLDLRLFALAAENILSKQHESKPGETLEKAAEALMSLFRVCVADTRTSEDCTKRWGLLHLVNQFMKIYFKINKLNLCKPMIRAIEALPFKEQFQLSQLITYKYYTGRKAMFDFDYKTANELLSFAFDRCHRRSRKNKRRILIYLLPVKMLIGYLPRKSLLKKYNLNEFVDLVDGVRCGNIRLLNETFERHESFFISVGIYLIIERLKIVALRNLFKKVYLIKGNHQIDIDAFVKTLHWMNMRDVDADEVECLLANMIYEGKIKGYISHAHRKLVVSKKDAFPPLTV